jgi:hypothetical protein
VPAAVAAAGVAFEIVTGPGIVPHAWGIAGDLVITIGGDVGVAQLRAALESLAR